MRFVHEYHRLFRAILFVVVLCVVVLVWRDLVDPNILSLNSFGAFISAFILIGIAGIITHRLARWVAPAEKGRFDEDSEAIVTGPDHPDR